MLYKYIKAVDTGAISPTPKEHKAMLTLFGPEIGKLVASPLLKGVALADLLCVSPTFLSNNRRHYRLMTAMDTNPEVAQLYQEARNYIYDRNRDLLDYLVCSEAKLVDTRDSFKKLTVISGVHLYLPKKLQNASD